MFHLFKSSVLSKKVIDLSNRASDHVLEPKCQAAHEKKKWLLHKKHLHVALVG